ncbi:unnamed protein product [Brassica oleracea]
MASSSSERVPITTALAITPAGSRVLQNPISEGVEEKRLKEASIKKEGDDADLIANVAKPESEIVADNKHKMDLSALAEVKKREDGLNKDVQIAKECISNQEIDDLVAATKRLIVQVVGKEAGFDEDSIKKRDKAALIASTAKLESELHEIRAEGQEDILVCPNFYPTGLSKNVKTDAEALGGSSVQEPKIDRKLRAEIDFTSPSSTPPAFINIVDHPCLLWDVKDPKKDLTSVKNWRDEGRGGPVRNQGNHNNCWTYSSTDVYSSHRLRNEEDEDFRVMSARYLTFYVKESPRDAKTDYSCVKNPPSRTQKLFHFGADVEFMESDKIEDLQKMLLHQPVSANMILYYPEYNNILTLEEIYEGPTSEKSVYKGIHAVLVLAILRFLGKLVALVKLSHGIKTGESGYMYISLSKMIVNVEYSVDKNLLCLLKRKTEDAIAEPSYLLRDFTGVNYGDSPGDITYLARYDFVDQKAKSETVHCFYCWIEVKSVLLAHHICVCTLYAYIEMSSCRLRNVGTKMWSRLFLFTMFGKNIQVETVKITKEKKIPNKQRKEFQEARMKQEMVMMKRQQQGQGQCQIAGAGAAFAGGTTIASADQSTISWEDINSLVNSDDASYFNGPNHV